MWRLVAGRGGFTSSWISERLAGSASTTNNPSTHTVEPRRHRPESWASVQEVAHSPELRHLSRLRPDPEPWMVLRDSGNKLHLYPSIPAIIKKQGRQLDHRSFSMGPPGLRFVACSMGLVCGKLLDLEIQDAGSCDITLAVGNPLTNRWRILPRLALPEQPEHYSMRVAESGSYTVGIRCTAGFFVYCSKSQAWEVQPGKRAVESNGLFRTTTSCFKHGEATVVSVDKSSTPWRSITLTTSGRVLLESPNQRLTQVLMEGMKSMVAAFVPTLLLP